MHGLIFLWLHFQLILTTLPVSNEDVVLKIVLANKGNREGAGIKAVSDSYQEAAPQL